MLRNKKIGIYLLTFPDNSMYIGQTRNLTMRKNSHITEKNPCSLKTPFETFGRKSFTCKMIHSLPKDIGNNYLNEYEKIYIKQYKECGYILWNIQEGGAYPKTTDETKAKISKSRLGRSPSAETRLKISQSNRKLGRRISDSHLQKLKKSFSKKVYQYTKEGIFVNQWDSASDAIRFYKNKNISEAANGKHETASGFKWSYIIK